MLRDANGRYQQTQSSAQIVDALVMAYTLHGSFADMWANDYWAVFAESLTDGFRLPLEDLVWFGIELQITVVLYLHDLLCLETVYHWVFSQVELLVDELEYGFLCLRDDVLVVPVSDLETL